ncbi:MAG: trigger factor [Hyphomicrobiaceae bacterium]|nr:trigger factor [Hyphomicrobiaceae bacterium]
MAKSTMQVSVTSAEGLKRTLKVVIGQVELGERFTTRLGEVKDTIQLKGFRRGKVPAAHIKKMFGRSLMAEVLQKAVEETTQQAITERKERPAIEPKVDLPEDQAEIERVISGEGDFAYSVTFEVMPEIQVAALDALELERLTADVPDEELAKTLEQLAERNTRYEAEEGREAGEGDQVTIDFVGRIDGTEFEGGKAEDAPVVIGQGGFIPGFEDGLKGAKAGEERVISATFPAEYPQSTLAGKTAEFSVTVKQVGRPVKPAIDDELAKGFGTESLDQLKERIRSQIASEFAQISRAKLKRVMLDALDKAHDFALPPTLVENEFNGIWADLMRRMEQAKKSFADEGKTEDEVRADYRKLAERRVRLGLVLGEIGTVAKVEVTQDELRNALFAEARRFPGQEKMVYEYFQSNPGAVSQLRAPLFEDKVVDYIASQAKVTERKVTKDELLAPLDESDASPAEAAKPEGA